MPRLVFLVTVWMALPALGDEWAAGPSTFTHDPRTGQRVTQYSPVGPVYAYPDRNVVQSGYRHIRNVIRAGDSADFLHVVEQWGQTPVRPYGEWQFPYRPYSVPYQQWGPPVFLGFPFPFPPFPFPPFPFPPFPPGGAGGMGVPGAMPDAGAGFGYPGYGTGFGYPGYGAGAFPGAYPASPYPPAGIP